MWPQLAPEESRAWSFARGTAGIAASITMGILLALLPVPAFAQGSSSHAGTVRIENEKERDIFTQLRCMCGGCERLPLTTCACGDAESAREAIRAKMVAGQTKDQIVLAYQKEYGTSALTVPPNTGGMQAIYAVPLVLIAAGGVGLAVLVRKWRNKDDDDKRGGGGAAGGSGGAKPTSEVPKKRDEYDARLDEELKDLDG